MTSRLLRRASRRSAIPAHAAHPAGAPADLHAPGENGNRPVGNGVVLEADTKALTLVQPPARASSDHGKPRSRRSVLPLVAIDLAMLAVASAFVFASDSTQSVSTVLVLVFALVTIAVILAGRGYATKLRVDVFDDIRLVVASTSVAAMTAVTIEALLRTNEPSAHDALLLWLVATILLTIGRWAATMFVLGRRTRLGAPTVIIGAGHVGRLTARRLLDHPELGLSPVGFLDKDPIEISGKPLPVPLLGASWDLEETVVANGVETAIVTFSSAPHDVMLSILDECTRLGVRVLVVPRLFERVPAKLQVTHVGGLPLLEMRPTSPRSLEYGVKYALDRIAALGLLLLFAPLLIGIALAVLISLGRPILYRQDRVGLDGRRFRMLKFRTMSAATEEAEHVLVFEPEQAPGGVEGADRRTRIGAFLRRTSLDELAQLFNVLRGEMSLVGPRPERPEFVAYFEERVRRYDARHRVKAGITGWAQIHRLRGKTSIADRVEWDNYYIENFSLWLDLKILLLTVPEVFRGRHE